MSNYPETRARDKATLEQQIMDSGIAKNDAEWWAMNEIKRLRAALEDVCGAATLRAGQGIAYAALNEETK